MAKADAYGHGLVPIVSFSIKELGLREFGVATLGEAEILRRELPKLKFDIYVFSELELQGGGHNSSRSRSQSYLDYRLIPVISSEEDLDLILTKRDFRYLPLCLKFNTGMNRLGLSSDALPKIITKLKGAKRTHIFHLLSHFSTSSSLKVTAEQRERFIHLKSQLKAHGIQVERTSLANSGAIEQGIALEESHVRPGLMLYGPSALGLASDPGLWRGRLISRLETYILEVFPVKKGTPIGYGATPCPSEGHIALIPLGYGDGFSTHFQGVALKWYGLEGHVFGRVNMDMAQIFFPGPLPFGLKRNTSALIWSDDPIEFLSLCDQAKIIPYEVFCQLKNRMPRIYEL